MKTGWLCYQTFCLDQFLEGRSPPTPRGKSPFLEKPSLSLNRQVEKGAHDRTLGSAFEEIFSIKRQKRGKPVVSGAGPA